MIAVVFQTMRPVASESVEAERDRISPDVALPAIAAPGDPDTGTGEQHRETRTTIVPATALLGYLGLFFLGLAFYFFVVFCVARGLLRGVGFGPAILIQCFGMTLVMVGFIIWLAPLAQLMELWYHHWLPTLRARRGACPGCGHRGAAGFASSTGRCAECGGALRAPAAMEFGWSTVRRFALVCGLAYLAGSGAGLLWLGLDERSFARECAVRPATPMERQRAWPASFSTLRYDGEEFTSFSISESEIRPLPAPRRGG